MAQVHADIVLEQDDILFEVETPIGKCVVYRPGEEEMQRTKIIAKEIFVTAFSSRYTEYHLESRSVEPIEKWLRLKEGYTLASWLSATFDDEYTEYVLGQKSFIYVRDNHKNLIGWLSHSLITSVGDVYLSQCSLEAASHNKRVTTAIATAIFNGDLIKIIFPGVKELKLIVRKINTIATHLYDKAGFTRDETIDPSVYGEAYDDRYVGYRKQIE